MNDPPRAQTCFQPPKCNPMCLTPSELRLSESLRTLTNPDSGSRFDAVRLWPNPPHPTPIHPTPPHPTPIHPTPPHPTPIHPTPPHPTPIHPTPPHPTPIHPTPPQSTPPHPNPPHPTPIHPTPPSSTPIHHTPLYSAPLHCTPGVERRQPPPKVPQANPPPAGHPAPPSGTAEEGPRDRREARHPSQSDAKEQDARRQSYAKPQEPLPPTASRPEPAEDDDPFPALRRYELEFMEPYDDYSDEAGYSEDEADWDCEGYGDRRHEVGYGALPPPPQRPPKLYFGDRRGDEDPREGAGHEPAWPGRQPHDGAHRGSAGAGPPPYGAPVGRLPHDDPRGAPQPPRPCAYAPAPHPRYEGYGPPLWDGVGAGAPQPGSGPHAQPPMYAERYDDQYRPEHRAECTRGEVGGGVPASYGPALMWGPEGSAPPPTFVTPGNVPYGDRLLHGSLQPAI